MKRLSTIIALALVITIGGVFAAWHYHRGEVSLEITRSATMASIQSDTAKGSITIDQSANNGNGNTLKFLVDDPDNRDYKAELMPSGNVVIQFQPATNADSTVQANGIAMKATVTVGGTQAKYNDANLGEITVFAPAATNSFVLNNGNPTKDKVTITAEQIAGCLVFNDGEDVILNTYDENLAYETAMKTYIIVITISEISQTA